MAILGVPPSASAKYPPPSASGGLGMGPMNGGIDDPCKVRPSLVTALPTAITPAAPSMSAATGSVAGGAEVHATLLSSTPFSCSLSALIFGGAAPEILRQGVRKFR
eukprot:4741043-Pyramimonas_sp.AAC.1